MTGSYEIWKQQALDAKFILSAGGIVNPYGVECTTVAWSWAAYLFPDVPVQATISLGDARTIYASADPTYFQKIPNEGGATPNLSPQPGDVAVYGPTPSPGYTNQYENADGHVGVVDNWDAIGLFLLQQDGSHQNLPVGVKYRPFSFSPLLGLLRPIIQGGPMGATAEEVNRISIAMVDREATPQDIKDFTGKAVIDIIDAYDKTDERAKIRGKVTDYDHLYKTAAEAQNQAAALQKELDGLTKPAILTQGIYQVK